jgi:hypothetical protein
LLYDRYGPFTGLLAVFYIEDGVPWAEIGSGGIEWEKLKERIDAFFAQELGANRNMTDE